MEKLTLKGKENRINVADERKDYYKTLNPHDSNDICLLLWDLKRFFNAPIEKAIEKYFNEKESPFW